MDQVFSMISDSLPTIELILQSKLIANTQLLNLLIPMVPFLLRLQEPTHFINPRNDVSWCKIVTLYAHSCRKHHQTLCQSTIDAIIEVSKYLFVRNLTPATFFSLADERHAKEARLLLTKIKLEDVKEFVEFELPSTVETEGESTFERLCSKSIFWIERCCSSKINLAYLFEVYPLSFGIFVSGFRGVKVDKVSVIIEYMRVFLLIISKFKLDVLMMGLQGLLVRMMLSIEDQALLDLMEQVVECIKKLQK